ncbi:MAG: hypothetical protein D3917_13090 [Candidatus Electrothrix sp. AX5]|nr:hypothetical protein [Candidatus Electrothrix sp. AX5]
MTLEYQQQYEEFIKQKGVGSNDVVADSVKSYVSYLNSVSRYLEITVGPSTLASDADIQNIAKNLKGKVHDKTINNYKSAMKRYVEMVKHFDLCG